MRFLYGPSERFTNQKSVKCLIHSRSFDILIVVFFSFLYFSSLPLLVYLCVGLVHSKSRPRTLVRCGERCTDTRKVLLPICVQEGGDHCKVGGGHPLGRKDGFKHYASCGEQKVEHGSSKSDDPIRDGSRGRYQRSIVHVRTNTRTQGRRLLIVWPYWHRGLHTSNAIHA